MEEAAGGEEIELKAIPLQFTVTKPESDVDDDITEIAPALPAQPR